MSNQDDSREKAQIRHFGLEKFNEGNRGQEYNPDALLREGDETYSLELKSSPDKRMVKRYRNKGKPNEYSFKEEATKASVSTARGFGSPKAYDWREKLKGGGVVFSKYQGLIFDGSTFMEHWFVSIENLGPWIDEKVIKPYNEGRQPSARSPGYYGVEEAKKELLPRVSDWSEAKQKRLMHTIKAGAAINDPKISWEYIKENGVQCEDREALLDILRKNKLILEGGEL